MLYPFLSFYFYLFCVLMLASCFHLVSGFYLRMLSCVEDLLFVFQQFYCDVPRCGFLCGFLLGICSASWICDLISVVWYISSIFFKFWVVFRYCLSVILFHLPFQDSSWTYVWPLQHVQYVFYALICLFHFFPLSISLHIFLLTYIQNH